MNEPHAPFFYNGYYHIFYQANLHAPIWDSIQWGHLATKIWFIGRICRWHSENGFYDESLDAGQEVDWLTKMVCRAFITRLEITIVFRIKQLHWHSRKIQKKIRF